MRKIQRQRETETERPSEKDTDKQRVRETDRDCDRQTDFFLTTGEAHTNGQLKNLF